MACQIPHDLITKLQISLREQANLSSYDPDDPSFPNLPSPEESIAELDTSLDSHRCKNCKGRLLRGMESLFCVFCGREQNKDLPPEPINFTNTLGYRWLLQHLQLDGSETVGTLYDMETSRTHKALQDELPLSELLNLVIRWPSGLEKIGSSVSDEPAAWPYSSLNLAGVDIGSFFMEGKEVNVSDAPTQNNLNGGTGSIPSNGQNLFENAQVSDAAVVRLVEGNQSRKDEPGDSIGGWEADFQSAGSETHHKKSKSSDAFGGSSADLSGHLDTVFRSKENSSNGNFPSASSAGDWFTQGTRNTSDFVIANEAKQFTIAINAGHIGQLEKEGASSLTIGNESQNDESQNGRSKESNDESINDDDHFDIWNDFASSTSAQDNMALKQTIIQGTPSVDQASEMSVFSNAEDFGHFKPAGKDDSSNEFTFSNIDRIQGDKWQTGENKESNDKSNDDDDLFSDWNDFASSTGVRDNTFWKQTVNQGTLSVDETSEMFVFSNAEENGLIKPAEKDDSSNELTSSSIDIIQGDRWQTSGNKKSNDNVINDDNLVDTWNDFAIFAHDNSSLKQTVNQVTPVEQTSQSYNFGSFEDFQKIKTADEDDSWNEFTSSKSMQDPFSIYDNKTVENSVLESSFSGTNSLLVNNLHGKDGKDDIFFDDWNDFTSLSGVHDSLHSSWKPTANHTIKSAEQDQEVNLFSNEQMQGFDLHGILGADLIQSSSSQQSSFAEVNAVQSEASVSERIACENLRDEEVARLDCYGASRWSNTDKEVLGPLETNESSRTHMLPSDKLRLSDRLNSVVQWPSELEKFGSGSSDETVILQPSTSNIGGPVIPDLFTDSWEPNAADALEKQIVPSKPNEGAWSIPSHGQNNHNLFENVQHSDTAVKLAEGDENPKEETDDSFGDWEADFQSAGSKTHHKKSKSADAFAGSSVDSAQFDVVFGSEMDYALGKTKERAISDDWCIYGTWNTSKSAIASEDKQLTMAINAEHFGESENANASFSTIENGGSKESVDETIDYDDSFDEWNDFTSSTGARDNSSPGQIVSQVTPFAEEISEMYVFHNTKTTIGEDSWNGFISSKSLEDPSSGTKITNGDDSWNDFISSKSVQDPSHGSGDKTVNNMIPESIFLGRSNSLKVNMLHSNGDILLDDWNDFTSLHGSSKSSRKQTTNHIITSIESDQKVNLFSSDTKSKDFDFGSLL